MWKSKFLLMGVVLGVIVAAVPGAFADEWTEYLGSEKIRDIEEDSSGDYWIATYNNGAYFYDGSDFTNYDNELAHEQVYDISIAPNGDVWFATREGVTKYDGSNFTTYDEGNSDLTEDDCRAIAVDSSGVVWIGSDGGGLDKFDGTNWTNYNRSNSDILDDIVYGVTIASNGDVWCGVWNDGISVFDGSNWTNYDTGDGLIHDRIWQIAFESDGTAWIATEEGVSEFDGTNWTDWTTSDGLSDDESFAISVDSDNQVWVSGYDGVSRIKPSGNVTTWNENDGLAHKTGHANYAETPTKIWFGTESGLNLFEPTPPPPPGQATNPSPADGATDVSVDADLSWTAGSGATSHDVYFGTDSSPDAGEFQGNQTATTYEPGTMENDTTYYWRIDEKNAGGTTTGHVWSFTTEAEAASPGQATNPNPADEATGVSINADLSWTAGSGATSHDVYFGTDSTPDETEFQGNQTATTFEPGTMDNDTTYYWRIDEVNAYGTTTGVVWSFTAEWTGTIYWVSNASDISSAMESANPGDTLVMRNGVWTDQNIWFEGKNGIAGQPITLTAETPGQVILNGDSRLHIGANYLVVNGLRFEGGDVGSGSIIEFREGGHANHCRLTNTAIIDYNPSKQSTRYFWVSLYGTYNRVDHCWFSGQNHSGVTLVAWLNGGSDYHQIDHNYFGNRPVGPENGYETIRIGDSSTSMDNAKVTVEYNYFEHCDGEIEIISNKSCENIYRYNTFVDNKGQLTLRHGDRCRVEGNFFFGNGISDTSGVRIVGEDHIVINNYFSGLNATGFWAALSMTNGVPDSALNEYFQVKNAIVAFNTFVDCKENFRIGIVCAGGDGTEPPLNCTIANNIVLGSQSPLITYETAPINMTYEGNIMYGADLGITNPGGISEIDPKLSLAADGIMRPDGDSPAINAAAGSYPDVTIDMDGQQRDDGSKDIGSDEVSAAPITISPLTPDDVGPSWM